IITPNKKTAISGVYFYELQLKCIDKNCKSKPWTLKLYDESSKTTQIRYAKDLAKCVKIQFQNYYNPKDRVDLKTLEFTIQNKDYYTEKKP
ncbi:unnamed protein product, partial [Rhizophagus irregularis]